MTTEDVSTTPTTTRAEAIVDFLEGEGVDYELIEHEPTMSAAAEARTMHQSPDQASRPPRSASPIRKCRWQRSHQSGRPRRCLAGSASSADPYCTTVAPERFADAGSKDARDDRCMWTARLHLD